MKVCTCGEPVSDAFFRVFNVDGELHCCPECDDHRMHGSSRQYVPGANYLGESSSGDRKIVRPLYGQ